MTDRARSGTTATPTASSSLTLDDPTASANTMNDRYVASMTRGRRPAVRREGRHHRCRRHVGQEDVLRRRRPRRAGPGDARRRRPTIFGEIERIKADLRRLETLGRPVVAAINGSALGGGLEIALACSPPDRGRRRHAVEIGLPEVTLGLLPGAGGVTRTVRMFGLQDALMNVLLQGQRNKPAQALKSSVWSTSWSTTSTRCCRAAEQWVLEHRDDAEARDPALGPAGLPDPRRHPVDARSSRSSCRRSRPTCASSSRARHTRRRGRSCRAAVEGAQVDFETATRIESRYFVDLVTGPIART